MELWLWGGDGYAVPVEAGDDLVRPVVGRVGEGVDVRGQAGGGGGVDAACVVVDACLDYCLAHVPCDLPLL